ncbi:MAG TPA: hypothetical protein VJX67_03855 [Blastocatellia bacterium]|nr:hypothetical protein [Blastocatellia bacterium]
MANLSVIRLFSLVLLMVSPIMGYPRQESDEPDPAKAQTTIREAIAARGGEAYLNIHALIGRGEYTPFEKGASTIPQQFLDYIVYPAKERTEFGKGGQKFIQTNVDSTGWSYDGPAKLIKDQTEAQIKQNLQSNRYDLDNLLRKGWKAPDAKLTFLGRREVWTGTFSNAVKIDFSDGGTVTLFFDLHTKLPLMTQFRIITDDGPRTDQVRYYTWLDWDGVKFPKIQDSYREGVQTARIYYDDIKFNTDIPDKLFVKPASIKEVK